MPRLHILQAMAIMGTLVLACPRPAAAQETANIIGQVRLAGGGLPTSRVRVTLHSRGMVIGDTFADNEGRFGFYQLPANIYQIRISEEGYEPVEQTVAMSPVAIASQYVQIVLRAKPETQPGAPPGAASGGNPYLVSATDYHKKYAAEAVKEFEKGVRAEQQQKLEEAVKHYKKAIEIEPDFYPALNNLGTSYLSLRKFKDAESQFEKVIALSPNDSQGYFNLGKVFAFTERYADAERTLHEGLKREPDGALGHFLLGFIYLRAGHFDEAEKRLRWALQLDPNLSHARLELANLHVQRNQLEAAIGELQLFIEKYPADPLLPQAKKLLSKLESGRGKPQR